MGTEYSHSQYQTNYPDGSERHWWNLVRNELLLRLVRALPDPPSTIVEVGCGRGVVVDYLRHEGINCVGVELAPVRPMASVSHYVKSGTDALQVPEGERARFNVLMLLDVLEHLPKPADFVASLTKAYPNVRWVIITVPARMELWSNYDEHYGHFMRYSVPTLKDLVQECGLVPGRVGYFFHGIYPIALLLSKMGRRREVVLSPPRSRIALLAHKMMAKLLLLETRLLPRSAYGTSAYAVCAVNARSGNGEASTSRISG